MGCDDRDSAFDAQRDETEQILVDLCAAVPPGAPWFRPLLQAIARWRLPEEVVDGRRFRYLVGGEAFDWLLLAERLLDHLGDAVSAVEKDALLFHGRPPEEISTEEFRRAIGPSKHRAHLNYLYGVTVEEALQLAHEEDLAKERHANISARDAERTVFERIYGQPRDALLATFREEGGRGMSETISLDELKEFTYWLFKYRLRTSAPPRVASDTSRGLDRLARLEALRRPAASTLMPMNDVLDLRASIA